MNISFPSFGGSKSIVGLDVGSSCVKAVELAKSAYLEVRSATSEGKKDGKEDSGKEKSFRTTRTKNYAPQAGFGTKKSLHQEDQSTREGFPSPRTRATG